MYFTHWFVKKIILVQTADEEMKSLEKLDTKNVSVVNNYEFGPFFKNDSKNSSRLFRPQDKRLYGILGAVGIFYVILLTLLFKECFKGLALHAAVILGGVLPLLPLPVLIFYQIVALRRFSSLAFGIGMLLSLAFILVPVYLYSFILQS